jgi:hypothetical protein
MKCRGRTLTITVTIPRYAYGRMRDLERYAVDGYEFSVRENAPLRGGQVSSTKQATGSNTSGGPSPQKSRKIEEVKTIMAELGVLKRSGEREVVTLRTVLIHALKESYSGPVIASALGWVNSNVPKCLIRYESLKHFPDYQEAYYKVNQYLKSRQQTGYSGD